MSDRHDILDRLLQDHVTARRVMAALEAEVDRIAQFHTPDMAAVTQAAGFFSGYLAEIHHPIEDMIFTALTRAAPAQAAELRKIAEEHDEAGALVSQLVEVSAALADDADRSRAAFCRIARGLIAFARHHLRREESRFFVYAAEHLSPVSWRSIAVTARNLEATRAAAQARPSADRNRAGRSPRRQVALRR